ncbi:UNVERIFIED_CONTAM: hypothetical protein HDU68_012796, partial [Siphonaria sp. JEL0065]
TLPSIPESPKAQFSISSAPNPPKPVSFEITVKDVYQNPVVKYLHSSSRTMGDLLHARVGGSFYYKPSTLSGDVEKILMVGGGVGVAPLIGMLEHLVNESNTCPERKRNVTLIYSVRDEKELLFEERLNEICSIYGGEGKNGLSVQVQCYVTRYAKPQNEIEQPEPHQVHPNDSIQTKDVAEKSVKKFYGFYITSRLLSDYLSQADADMNDTVVYMCGPESLERAVYGYLKKLEFPLDRLYFEQWWK